MESVVAVRPLAFVHIGTHKTGTTALQRFLADNELALRAAGLYLPKTGRRDPGLAAQHNVAYELGHNASFDREAGTLEELAAELVAEASRSAICLSSEAFEALTFNRGGLSRLCSGLEWLGYDPRIVVYLRPQADYLESLYAEFVRAEWPLDFDSFFDHALRDRSFGDVTFAYSRLVGAFEDRFGLERLIVRPYPTAGDDAALVRDFLDIVAPGVPLEQLVPPPRLNRRLTFDDVLDRIGVAHPDRRNDEPFEPLSLVQIARIAARFGPENRLVEQRYGVRIAAVSHARLTREWTRSLSPRHGAFGPHRQRVAALRGVRYDPDAQRRWLNRSVALR
jgi:hypothetical protein